MRDTVPWGLGPPRRKDQHLLVSDAWGPYKGLILSPVTWKGQPSGAGFTSLSILIQMFLLLVSKTEEEGEQASDSQGQSLVTGGLLWGGETRPYSCYASQLFPGQLAMPRLLGVTEIFPV